MPQQCPNPWVIVRQLIGERCLECVAFDFVLISNSSERIAHELYAVYAGFLHLILAFTKSCLNAAGALVFHMSSICLSYYAILHLFFFRPRRCENYQKKNQFSDTSIRFVRQCLKHYRNSLFWWQMAVREKPSTKKWKVNQKAKPHHWLYRASHIKTCV